MKKIIILFGGMSAEHDVSVITALQVIEKIDKAKFEIYPIKQNEDGLFLYYENLTSKSNYLKIKPQIAIFGSDKNGSFFQTGGIIKNKTYIDAAFLAFHGGNGENGSIQGFLDTLNIAYTSANTESSSISMNKVLTKEVLEANNIKTVPWSRVFNWEIIEDIDLCTEKILKKLSLPIIIKPVHLGSSIGINTATTKIELKKYLLQASQIDSEILIEKFIKNFSEYNIAIRKIGNKIETSEIEQPISKDTILSFADKYQRGGKKSGGMASLNRELPAQISTTLKDTIQKISKEVFKLIRCKGMIRIDFMVSDKNVWVTEINPIPGSMAFYLWEASGVSFKELITDLIEQAIEDNKQKNSLKLSYKTDIIKKFINNKDH